MKNVYEEYRQRLINNNADILILEIFETFVGTDYIDNSLDLVQILETKDYKAILKELKEIQKSIYKNETKRYTGNEKLGYSNIVYGYILRVQSILNNERDIKRELLEESEKILKQEEIDITTAEKWIKKYTKFIKQNYKRYSKEYKLLTACNLTISNLKSDTTYITVEVNKELLRASIQIAKEVLTNYL